MLRPADKSGFTFNIYVLLLLVSISGTTKTGKVNLGDNNILPRVDSDLVSHLSSMLNRTKRGYLFRPNAGKLSNKSAFGPLSIPQSAFSPLNSDANNFATNIQNSFRARSFEALGETNANQFNPNEIGSLYPLNRPFQNNQNTGVFNNQKVMSCAVEPEDRIYNPSDAVNYNTFASNPESYTNLDSSKNIRSNPGSFQKGNMSEDIRIPTNGVKFFNTTPDNGLVLLSRLQNTLKQRGLSINTLLSLNSFKEGPPLWARAPVNANISNHIAFNNFENSEHV